MVDWTTRYRRIIDVYRLKLREIDPLECRFLDAQMEDMGEGWVVASDRSTDPPDLNRLMSAGEIAAEYGLTRHWIYDWARRHPDKIQKHKAGGRVLFRLGEVLRYQAQR